MRRLALSLILVFNSFAFAACSGYKAASLPNNPASESTTSQDPAQLKKGAQARLHLVSGEVHEGEVMAVSDETVVLGNPSNHGFVEQVYAITDIEKCEVEALSTAGTVAGVGLVLVIVALGVFLWGLEFSGFS
jgi:hypothetical protein